MKRPTLLRLAACFLPLLGSVSAPAQKAVKNISKQTLKAGERAALSLQKELNASVHAARTAARTECIARKHRPQNGKSLNPPPLNIDKIKEILRLTPDPSQALPLVWELQDAYGNRGLFNQLAMRVYTQNFGLVTPHLNKLFKKISFLNHRPTEARFVARMHFLAENQERIIREMTTQAIPKINIRMRYTSDVDKLTRHNFDANKLVLSIEKPMHPGPEKDFPVRHINGGTSFSVPTGEYAIYQYAGPIDLLPMMYRYLLNGSRRNSPITIVFDEPAQSLAMYNEDQTLWLRVTPHEYENINKLHIHLNEQRGVSFTDVNGKRQTAAVNVNLSIPILPPDNLPADKTLARQFLYEKMVLNPIKNLQGSMHVKIERRSIF